MAAPAWAIALVEEIAKEEGRLETPQLTWHRSSLHRDTTGRAWPVEGRIHITAGKDRRDQKQAVLHEMAHWLMPAGEHHGPKFWDKAWELYRRYKLPVNAVLRREGGYRAEAIAAARRAGIRVSEHRERAIARTRR